MACEVSAIFAAITATPAIIDHNSILDRTNTTVLNNNSICTLPAIVQPGKKLSALPVGIYFSSIGISPYQLWLVCLHYLV